MIATQSQLTAALALLELDGVARRMVLCTPELSDEQLRDIAIAADADAIVFDSPDPPEVATAPLMASISPTLADGAVRRVCTEQTEWVLLTSGTSGAPKLVAHSLASLAGALPRTYGGPDVAIWSTFYDIRRYGGLQIFLRAVLSGSRLVLSSTEEATRDFLARAGAAGVSHMSGTPSHWRRALMSGAAALLAPRYVRLSGEIVDQTVLDSLRNSFPKAQITHAFASTEAGVAFDISDGRAGFPAELTLPGQCGIDVKVEDGTLRIRSARTASRYLGADDRPIPGIDGFVDTGDIVGLRDGRYYFLGRRGGVINVGGFKVHPEEVEEVINADSRVRVSLVRARKSPITGAVVVADVELANGIGAALDADALEGLRRDLLAACRRILPAYKVPAVLRFVSTLELSPAGKLVRPVA